MKATVNCLTNCNKSKTSSHSSCYVIIALVIILTVLMIHYLYVLFLSSNFKVGILEESSFNYYKN